MNFIHPQIYTLFLHKSTRILPKPIIKNIFGLVMDMEKLRGLEMCHEKYGRCNYNLSKSYPIPEPHENRKWWEFTEISLYSYKRWWEHKKCYYIYNHITPHNMCTHNMWAFMILRKCNYCRVSDKIHINANSGYLFWSEFIKKRIRNFQYFKDGLYI